MKLKKKFALSFRCFRGEWEHKETYDTKPEAREAMNKAAIYWGEWKIEEVYGKDEPADLL